jgi:EpsI family protein
VLLVAGLWSGLAWAMQQSDGAAAGAALAMPESLQEWSMSAPEAWTWTPRVLGPDRTARAFYGAGGLPVGVYVAQYNRQRQGAELVNSRNVMVAEQDPVWREGPVSLHRPDVPGGPDEVRESEIKGHQSLLTWHWYRVGGRYTTSRYLAKVLEAVARLTFSRSDGALIAVTTPLGPDRARSRQRLAAFLGAAMPALEDAMRHAAGH